MRLGCLLPALTLGCLLGGGQGMYTWVTNREPKVYDIDTYLSTNPTAKWVRITGGWVDFSAATYKSFANTAPTELYLPVRSTNSPAGAKIQVLVATRDPALLDAMDKTRNMTAVNALRYLVEHQINPLVHRDVQGLLRYGIESDDKTMRKLKAVNNNLADDVVVLEEGKKPDFALSSALVCIGLLLAGWQIKRAARNSSQSPPPPPIAPPPMPPPPTDPPLRQS